MCGRYYCDLKTFQFAQQLTHTDESEEEGDFCPSEDISVIIYKDGKMRMEKMSWGYTTKQSLVINARCETLLEKAFFQEDALKHRCIIVSQGFYEWDAHKHKISFQSKNHQPLFMAGIYRGDKKEVVIITTEANSVMKPIHSRMPLLIEEKDMMDWLTNNNRLNEFLMSSSDNLEIVSGNIQQSLF